MMFNKDNLELILEKYKGDSFKATTPSFPVCKGIGYSENDAIDKLCNYREVGEEFNFSSNEEVSILSLFERICSLTNTDKEEILNFGPERPGKDMFYRLDISKSKNILNWEPNFFLNQGLNDVNNWINKNYKELSEMSWEYSHKD